MIVRAMLVAMLALGLVGCETTQKAVTEAKQVIARKSVVETAAEDGQFSKLVTAIKTAGLEQALSEKGPFTVFAPTDDAFASLGEGEFAKLLQDKARLKSILEYHVVQASITSDKVVPASIKSLGGGTLSTSLEGKTVKVNDATVIRANVIAKNGVIHAIDKVLMPGGK